MYIKDRDSAGTDEIVTN